MRTWRVRTCCGFSLSIALWACSSAGTSSVDPSNPTASDAEKTGLFDGSVDTRGTAIAAPDDEASYLFDQTALRTYELKLAQPDLDTINNDPVAEEYVSGMLVFENQTYGPVGVRYKGSFGGFIGCTSSDSFIPSGSKTCPKLSMKVSFNWQDPEGNFYGLRKILFHSMNSDDSLMRDRLAYSLFREMGVPAPRSVHARLLINGKFVGLFAFVEEVDGRFTRSRFSDGGEGNLYKEVWPIHSNEQTYLNALETNRDAAPLSTKILNFAQRLAKADDKELPTLIDEHMNREVTLGYVAVDRTIRNDDGAFHFYCGVQAGQGNNPGAYGNHNYFFYEEAASDQLWLIPWDLDLSFRGERSVTPITTDWDDTTADCACVHNGPFGIGQRAPACDPLVRGWAGMQSDFDARVRAFLDGPFSAASVTNNLDAWAAQIAPAVAEAAAADPLQLSVANWNAALSSLRDEIAALRASAEGLSIVKTSSRP